jgi:2-succinyl-6-hydroxy-2,4-cyclohexadiene-1-carboxylate synthase
MAPALVLLHGFTHTGASWDPVLAALGESYRALAPDIRGHGVASTCEPVTLDRVLADLDSLAGESFTLAGYSMGGRIALHAALAFKERVKRLVLISASPGIEDDAERALRAVADEQLAAVLERITIEEFIARWEANPVLARQPSRVVAELRADRLRNHPEGLARALRGLGTGALPSLWHRLGELSMPVLVLAGERDRKFATIAEQMSSSIPNVELEIVSGAGHALHLERPDRVAELIR